MDREDIEESKSQVKGITTSTLNIARIDWNLTLPPMMIRIGETTDGKKISTKGTAEIVGSIDIKAGIHQWRFLVEKIISPRSSHSEVVFGVIDKNTWDAKVHTDNYCLNYYTGFSTNGNVIYGMFFNEDREEDEEYGPLSKGPNSIAKITLNQEIVVTFDKDKGILKMRAVSSGTESTLILNDPKYNTYKPYFSVSSASVTLLEAN